MSDTSHTPTVSNTAYSCPADFVIFNTEVCHYRAFVQRDGWKPCKVRCKGHWRVYVKRWRVCAGCGMLNVGDRFNTCVVCGGELLGKEKEGGNE